MKTYYRPIWTSGRYDVDTHSAIFYNLLSGMSFFFEDKSADVIGAILSSGRNGVINVTEIKNTTELDLPTIESFFCLLLDVGLLANTYPDMKIIKDERNKWSKIRSQSHQRLLMPFEPLQSVDAERDYLKRAKPQIFSLLIELTYRCSANCIHCYNPGASRNDNEINTRTISGELSLDDYKRIIDEFYELGMVRVCLSGGDPFSKSIVWDIMEYLYSKDIVFDVYTNGIRLKGKEDSLSELFPCTVGVSIYSDKPAVHDTITRVPHSLERSLNVIKELARLSIPIAIKCCVMHNNLKSYRGVAKIADMYSAALQLECNIFDSVDGDKCVSQYLRLNHDEMQVVLRDPDIPQYVGPELRNYGAKILPQDRNACAAGGAGFCLTPDGTLTLCVSFPLAIGNLKKEKLAELILNTQLSWWKSRQLSDYEECGKYDYCQFCCLCPGLNFSSSGSPLKASDSNCFLAKVRYELAESLKMGIDPLNGNSIDDAIALLPEVDTTFIKRIQSKNYYKSNIT